MTQGTTPTPSPTFLVAGALLIAGGAFVAGVGYGQWRATSTGDFNVRAAAPTPVTAHAAPTAPRTPAPTCPPGAVGLGGGTFQLGSADGVGEDDEHPAYSTTLTAYCVDQTEVTVAAYRACVTAGRCTPPSGAQSGGRFCTWDAPGLETHPVNCLDWNQATAYCRWKEGRLPTEAEWEHAARGDDDRTFPWGEEAPDETRQNACGSECAALGADAGQAWEPLYGATDGFGATSPVGSYRLGQSPAGVQDMAGNVWEWVADWYDATAYRTAAGASDPHGPANGDRRVTRGGGWVAGSASALRATDRNAEPPDAARDYLGFRCAYGGH